MKLWDCESLNLDDFHKQTTLPDLHATQSRFPLPQKIGPYKIESLLNKGGMSVLYLGTHPDTAQPLVIKVLLPKYLKNKEIANRFLKEAQIIGITNHPNIVRLYGQGQWEKGLYIAMEFIQGISLRQFIQQKSLSHKRALEIILQVAYALCHLHTHGVIHRDLKPENILITETGEIKVIDFGIAQLHGEEERITQKKRMMGTPVYMSPEQKENPTQVGYSSDIYSLGIIAYELILGRLSHGVIHLALLSKPFRTIIEKALKTDPAERYQDIVDFITDISQYIKTLSSENEEREEETSDEVLNMIQETRSILIPKKGPRWPQVEIGIAVHGGISLSSLYLDFFRLTENRYCIALAEPLESGVASLLHSSILRGMVRMAIQLHFQNGKKEQHPIKMLHTLNQALSEDPMDQDFGLCILFLNPDKDQLSFISCSYTNLWHIPDGSKKVRVLSTPNPPLGAHAVSTLLETADNWNSGDTLILHSLGLTPNKGEEVFIEEYLLLPAQNQAEKILEKMTAQKKGLPKRASAVLSIHRIF
ncbi:MAG TPA: protein kinase [Chlamydiales bacterium]|nr:protein kinase [Chlamydiales bacterium]